MFTHVFLGAKDIEASRQFYDAALGALGHAPGAGGGNRYVYRTPSGTFGITLPINGESATFGNGSTFGFAAKSEDEVNAFHAAGVANGGVSCEDPPACAPTQHLATSSPTCVTQRATRFARCTAHRLNKQHQA